MSTVLLLISAIIHLLPLSGVRGVYAWNGVSRNVGDESSLTAMKR